MPKNLTKVTPVVKNKVITSSPIGWRHVLEDIEKDLKRLNGFRRIVAGKISRNEPWRGTVLPATPLQKENSPTQN